MTANVFGLGEGGDFHHPPRRIDAENQCLIKHKCVCGALNRHFLVGAVIASGSCPPSLQTVVNIEFLCH